MPARLIVLYLVMMIGIACASIVSTTETQVKILLSVPVVVSAVFLVYIISQWRKK